MKTAIHIGDTVVVDDGKSAFYGLVKGIHLFSYDVFHCSGIYDSDAKELDEWLTIRRYPRWRVFRACMDDVEKLFDEGKRD